MLFFYDLHSEVLCLLVFFFFLTKIGTKQHSSRKWDVILFISYKNFQPYGIIG